MRKTLKFKTYEEFREARRLAESENKYPIVDSYCDKEAWIFTLTLVTMYKKKSSPHLKKGE